MQHEEKSVPTSVKNIPLHWAAGRVRPPHAVVRRRHPPGRARGGGTQCRWAAAPTRRAAWPPLARCSARPPACPCGGCVGRLDRGRARASEGLEQRLAWPRLGEAPVPVGPRREPSRSAHRPASPRQAAAERDVVEEGAVLRLVVGHESAPMARRACSAYRVRNRSPSWFPRRARGDPGRRTVAGVTRDHRAPVSAANGPPRWSAVPKGSEAPKLAVLNHPQHVPQPSIPKTAPQTQNVWKSSEVLRRSSCRRRANLTCDSASHLRERTVVGWSTEHQYQPSVDVPSHHPLLVRTVVRRIFFFIASFFFV